MRYKASVAEFKIQRCLGRGGFGEVYRGVMSRGGGIAMDVAIKVLRADLDPSSQGVQRLRDEGRLLGRLTHPTILRVYDLVVIEGRAALISEFVDGDDLARVIQTSRRPPARAVFEIVAQVAAALDAAWSWPSVTDGQPLHLVHRDIKPDNIRLDHHGVVKLLDFGIAQASAIEREAETSVNIIMGSAQYLAPERMVQQEVGPEADVFALGCTLFEALTGEALFLRKSMRQMYLLMVDAERFEAFLQERWAILDGRLDHDRGRALLRSMLSHVKADRPTAGEVAARCDAICEGLGGYTLRRWAREHDWPKPDAAPEPGPLEGRVFTSVQSLPAPEARTLALHAIEERELPDLADSLTDPGHRRPVLGELTADVPSPSDEDTNSPWSTSEMLALRKAQRRAEEEDIDAPTVEVKLPAALNPSQPSSSGGLRFDPNVTYPVFGFDDDTTGFRPLPKPVVEPPSGSRDPVLIHPPALVEAPADEDRTPTDEKDLLPKEVDAPRADLLSAPARGEESFDVLVDDGAEEDAPTQGQSEELTLAAEEALRSIEARRESARASAPDDDDDYVPQPGDIDLSDVFQSTGPSVTLRVAPPGAPPIQRPLSPAPKVRSTQGTNRISVMVLSGLLGVLVGAVVISVPALIYWLLVG